MSCSFLWPGDENIPLELYRPSGKSLVIISGVYNGTQRMELPLSKQPLRAWAGHRTSAPKRCSLKLFESQGIQEQNLAHFTAEALKLWEVK